MFYIFLFIIGLAVGSFLNVVISRLYTKEKILLARSHCPNCKKILAWYDLIPLVSFVFTLGKCRYCRQKISWQYPLVEFFTGILFVLVGWFVFKGFLCHQLLYCYIAILLYCFFISCLIVIFVYDLKHFVIPDKVIYPAIIAAFSYQITRALSLNLSISQPLNLSTSQSLNLFISQSLNLSIAAAIAAGFFLLLVLFSRGRWMGWGDVKMALFIGLLLGWPNILVALTLAFVIGGILGLILILAQRKTLKSQIPFGPFLTIATLISIFWGNQLINWYLTFVGYY